MAKYKVQEYGVIDTETGASIPAVPGNRHWQEYQAWLKEGNTPDPEFTEAELAEQEKQAALEAVYQTMDDEIAQPLQVDINGATYFMDARDDSASRFKGGIDLAAMLGETEMQMVDYYNHVHTVSLEDALEICKQQAVAFRTAYLKRAVDRDSILKEGV